MCKAYIIGERKNNLPEPCISQERLQEIKSRVFLECVDKALEEFFGKPISSQQKENEDEEKF